MVACQPSAECWYCGIIEYSRGRLSRHLCSNITVCLFLLSCLFVCFSQQILFAIIFLFLACNCCCCDVFVFLWFSFKYLTITPIDYRLFIFIFVLCVCHPVAPPASLAFIPVGVNW
jgi:hypothetical protein